MRSTIRKVSPCSLQHTSSSEDGAETILQRWAAYATNGHGGNVELRNLDPSSFRLSVLRVFDPATPTREIDAAESGTAPRLSDDDAPRPDAD